mmetsp:Transcript_65627/g.122354  ORF Transcript_65627/g.122354 Transcript_65627/m.122354 type:complete len:169 (+) Transcript_65627:77-583(+)
MFLCCKQGKDDAESTEVVGMDVNKSDDPAKGFAQEEAKEELAAPAEEPAPPPAEETQATPEPEPVAPPPEEPKELEEFTVTLERAAGSKLGMVIGERPSEPQKSFIREVKPGGLVEAWNKEHPTQLMTEGCMIAEVNGETTHDKMFKIISDKDVQTLKMLIRPPAKTS